MKRKQFFIFLVLFCFLCTVIATAQNRTSSGGADLVTQAENLAHRAELLASRTSTAKSTERNVSQQDFDQFQDQIAKFDINYAYFFGSGGTFSDADTRKITDAMRRLQIAEGQIERNIERLLRDM